MHDKIPLKTHRPAVWIILKNWAFGVRPEPRKLGIFKSQIDFKLEKMEESSWR